MGVSVNLSVTRCLAVPLRRTRISEGLRSFFHLFPTMKKIFTLILLSMITFNAIHAEVTWNLSDDGTLTISGTDMPNYSTNNQPWKSQKGAIQKVVIENGVTNIGRYAFYACNNLIAVAIPSSVTNIGDRAFRGCSGLTSITIPNSVTSIGENAFKDCSGLTSISIGVVFKYIKEQFNDCTNITSVTLFDGVTSIREEAFYNCSSLTSVTIPNSVTSIEAFAFRN